MITNNKRVLLVNYEMTYTGSPRVLYNLATVMQELGYRPSVWTFNLGGFEHEFKDIDIDVQVITIEEMNSGRLDREIKKYKFVIVNTIFCIDFAVYAQQFRKTFLYIMEASNILHLMRDCNLNEKKIYQVKNIVCVSEYAKKSIYRLYGIENIYVLHNFVVKWSPNESKKGSRDKIRFLVSGTIEYRKGQDIALMAFKLMSKSQIQKAELHILGACPEWSKQYQTNLLNNKINNVYFHNAIDDIKELYEFYDTMDVFLIPSRDESCSLVALEAAMLGKAIVVTENTGAKYLFDEHSECIVPTGDIIALSNCMKKYIEIPQLISDEGKNNFNSYLEKATVDVYKKNLQNLLVTLRKTKYINVKRKNTMIENGDVMYMENELLEKEVICSVIFKSDCEMQEVLETFRSIEAQQLKENEYIQLFMDMDVINLNNEAFNEQVIILPIANLSSLSIVGKWICACRGGDIFSPMYFSGIYNCIKKSDTVNIARFYKENDSHFMQNIFYERNQVVFIDKNPEVVIDYFETAWLPKKFFNEALFWENDIWYSWIQNVMYTILNQKKYEILGEKIDEMVFGFDALINSEIPTLETLKYVYIRLINYSVSKYGNVCNLIQYSLLNMYKKFISNRRNFQNIMEDYDMNIEEYKKFAIYCLTFINEQILLKDNSLSLEQKIYIVRQKENGILKYIIDNKKLSITNQTEKIKIQYSPIVEYMFASILDDQLKIEGTLFLPFSPDNTPIKIYFKYADNYYEANLLKNNDPERVFDTEIICERNFYSVKIPLIQDDEISCFVELNGEKIECTRYMYSRFFPVSMQTPGQFVVQNDWILKCKLAKLNIEKDINQKWKDYENKFSANLKASYKYLREIYYTKNKGKRVWLLWDRPNQAGDNGEALFEYLVNSNECKEEVYFVISSSSTDYKRLHKLYPDRVVDVGSLKHQQLFVISDILIGSQTDSVMWPLDPKVFRDIISQKPFVFLQHGITKNDMSRNYSRYYQNIRLFVTAGISEYENTKNIVNYGFSESMVKLLGFPRFDKLEDKKKKYIAILPTWRKYCVNNNSNGEIKDNFNESEYFLFYSKLLKNTELLNMCEKTGFKLIFLQHNIMKKTDEKFLQHECIEFGDATWSYNRVISEASILITDYSSVSFDFAYLKKPIIYCQFDKEKFYKTHTYQEGYFDYERDGFGPVVFSVEDTKKYISRYLNMGCKMEDKYIERVNRFFEFHDKNNCARVADAIREVKLTNE